MAFPPPFLDDIRARVPLADEVGKRLRLQRRGREFVGLCPFHRENTPSFTVVEDKGFFHCFGCGAHGDVIGFAMRMENLSFPEAVERLASMAGLEVPVESPRQRDEARRLASLHDVLEEACRWFQEQLRSPAGDPVRSYLTRRGVQPPTRERFRLGYAPEGRAGLLRHLTGKKVSEALLGEAGLVRDGTAGGGIVDRFRDRLIFPIGDRSGRVVAFGGRAMGDHPAKYLNSPETPLFRKGQLLYGHAQARKAAREAGTVVVAEGYMDVIALSQAGFAHAVAPLGTALSEAQIALLWRLADEPILCLDGDEAGRRAALRAAERALPLLRPGKSLRFAALPLGEDPDDVLRQRGREAMAALLERPDSLLDLLWLGRTRHGRFDTPERRAGLERALERAVEGIPDRSVRFHYHIALRERLRRSFAPAPRARMARGASRSRGRAGTAFMPERPPSAVAAAGRADDRARGERLLLCLPMRVPELLPGVAEGLAEIAFASPGYDALRDALLHLATGEEVLDRHALQRHLTATGVSAVAQRVLPGAERGADDDPSLRVEALGEAERLWHDAFELYRHRVLSREIESDAAAWAVDQSEEGWRRLKAKQDLKQVAEARLSRIGDEAGEGL